MANPPIPAVTKRAATIDFIDHKLPKHHPAFASQLVQYDEMTKQYIPAAPSLATNKTNSLVALPPSHPSPGSNPPTRPVWTNTNAMKFWMGIFPDSMARFKCT